MKTSAHVSQTIDARHASSDEGFQSCEINDPLLKNPVVFYYKDPADWLKAEYGNVKYKGKFATHAAKVPHLPRHNMLLRRYWGYLEVTLVPT